MSAKVKLSSALAGEEEFNGLDDWAEALLQDPPPRLFVYGWVTRAKKMRDDVHNRDVPTVQFSRVEVEGTIADVPDAVRERMSDLQRKRLTGDQDPLDFEDTEPKPKPTSVADEPTELAPRRRRRSSRSNGQEDGE